MQTFLLALMMAAPLTQAPSAEPVGNPEAGNGPFRAKLCYFCHGENGEGAFGPDLAGGRGLTFDQFKKSIRQPWGVMLAYNEQQLPDQQIADIYALMKTKPKGQPMQHWHWPQPPASAPIGQRIYINMGCGQCHEPENKFGRKWLGEHAKEMSYEYFAKQIYNHTDKWPRGGMGNYNRDRHPDILMREVYKFMVEDLGLRASLNTGIAVGKQEGGNTTYDVTITNAGVKDNGLTAEGVTAFVRVPAGAKVVAGTGPGYKGVQPLATLGLEPGLPLAPHPNEEGVTVREKQNLSGDVIVWKIPKIVAADKIALSFTLAGAPTPDLLKGFDGSTVHWEKPGRTAFGKKLVYRDLRTPDEGDHERIGLPRMPTPPPAK